MQSGQNQILSQAVDAIIMAFEPSVELLNPYYDTNVVDRAS